MVDEFDGGSFGDSSSGGSFGNDSTSEVTTTSWLNRLWASIKQIVVGMILFVVSFPLLFWNEGRAVRRAKDLAEGASSVEVISADLVDAQHDGHLVFLSGLATAEGSLTDDLFQISVENALRLNRRVQMYQWKENKEEKTEKQTGGSERTVTTFRYEQIWSDEVLPSQSFHTPEGHANPTRKPVEDSFKQAPVITVGAFALPSELISHIQSADLKPIVESDLERLPADLQKQYRVYNGEFYSGKDPKKPAIGDVRVEFSVTKPTDVSLIAQQQQTTFAPYLTQAKHELFELRTGRFTKDQFFKQLSDENTSLLWVLRLIGWLVMFFGILLVLYPVKVFADVVPIFGTIVETGLGLFAGLLSLALSLLTIAVGWFFYRPILAGVLIGTTIGILILMARLFRKKPKAVTA